MLTIQGCFLELFLVIYCNLKLLELYTDDQIQIYLKPLAAWCNADYIEQRVKMIKGDENRIHFENKEYMEYDFLGVNVGSRTRGANETQGVWEHSLTTRPINDLLGKI